ncbi:hypothetical protein [Ralstonia mannitolilytica]|uniref:hypothetical protein n=1 Tax=Ralstonia mannitolilytica TaxID=105219 RepID=UPI001FC9118D|nr:hypothetical protein [Ralstonia mannitolilytica]
MATKTATAQLSCSASLPIPEALPADGFTRWSGLKAFVPFSRETVEVIALICVLGAITWPASLVRRLCVLSLC